MPTKGTRTNLLPESVLATNSQVQSVGGAIRHRSVIDENRVYEGVQRLAKVRAVKIREETV